MPAGTFVNVTWPLPFDVPETFVLIGPPVSVTFAPETLLPAQRTVATIVPVGMGIVTLVVLPPVTVAETLALSPLFDAVTV